jgi:hypothetical protein
LYEQKEKNSPQKYLKKKEYLKANVNIFFANLWETSLWKHRKSLGLPKFIPQDYSIENMEGLEKNNT